TRFSRDWSSDVCSSDLLSARTHSQAFGRQARRGFLSAMRAAIVTAALLLAWSAGRAAQSALETLNVTAEQVPVERVLDGTIEAVSRGTVSAQTAGRVAEVLYGV